MFPRFAGGTRHLLLAEHGFVAEVEMQVSERLMGFVERHGNVRERHEYRPGSPYSQKPLTRFFETTGVCWSFTSLPRISKQAGRKLLEAFALTFGIQERDLRVGTFSARPSPLGPGQVQDLCIYDTTAGSLRLTQRLPEHFAETVALATESLPDDQDPALAAQLAALSAAAANLKATETAADADSGSTDDDWVILVASGEPAILTNASGTQEVEVAGFRYTPRGIMLDLKHRAQAVQWTVPAETVMQVHGESKLIRFNLMTGNRSTFRTHVITGETGRLENQFQSASSQLHGRGLCMLHGSGPPTEPCRADRRLGLFEPVEDAVTGSTQIRQLWLRSGDIGPKSTSSAIPKGAEGGT